MKGGRFFAKKNQVDDRDSDYDRAYRRLLELKDIEELDRDIIVEMIDQITVYENRKLKISYNFGNELEHLFSSVYCEDLEKKAI